MITDIRAVSMTCMFDQQIAYSTGGETNTLGKFGILFFGNVKLTIEKLKSPRLSYSLVVLANLKMKSGPPFSDPWSLLINVYKKYDTTYSPFHLRWNQFICLYRRYLLTTLFGMLIHVRPRSSHRPICRHTKRYE